MRFSDTTKKGINLLFVAGFISLACLHAQITNMKLENLSETTETNVFATFGQVFIKGEMMPDQTILASVDEDNLETQMDVKALHRDGSVRHAIVTVKLPSLGAAESKIVSLNKSSGQVPMPSLTTGGLINSSYNVTVRIDDGTVYTASATEAVTSDSSMQWLDGYLVREWIAQGQLKDNAQQEHEQLSVRFYIRAFEGYEKVRTEVVIENSKTFDVSPQNVTYDLEVEVAGEGTVFEQSNIEHYRQSRWSKIYQWGDTDSISIAHNARYIMRTGAVPNYDSTLNVPDFRLDEMSSEFAEGDDIMEIGYMEPYMPAPGGRSDIAPLPRWTARYLISQDQRAKDVTLGFGRQAGSWPIHYRDKSTGLPVSLDDYPNLTVVGSEPIFPDCAGNCDVPYEADVSHQPSLAYVPYLVTGDFFFLEELHFWANWDMFYGSPDRHGLSQGIMGWDQVRGQAWGLRTLGHAAYITPDDHAMKDYFVSKLMHNIQFYNNNWLYSNPLGYILNADWLDLDQWIATWMDDFLTWTFGHLVSLDFHEAIPFARYKSKFPVGRMTHEDMCWILASTYWPTIITPYPVSESSRPVQTWAEYKEVIIQSWDDNAMASFGIDLTGQTEALMDAPCGSAEMAEILGLSEGEMIGSSWNPQGYPSNLQPAIAVAVELGVTHAEEAWNIFENRAEKPTWLPGEGGGYDEHPQWAIVPNPFVNIDTTDITAVNERPPKPHADISIYPNPVRGTAEFKLNLEESFEGKIYVTDITGRKILQIGNDVFLEADQHTKNIKMHRLNSGMYFVVLQSHDGKQFYTRRFVKK